MEENLKKTCLYDSHVALGAKMSPFAGYMMPIQYEGIVAEHLAVRHKVGMFDVSHMGEIFVSGPDSLCYLNHIFTNDLSTLADGEALYGMLLYPDGGTVDDLIIYKEFEPDKYLAVVNAANIDKDYKWMKGNEEGFDAVIDNQSEAWGQIAVQGPEAEKTLVEVLGLKKASSITFYHYEEDTWKGKRLLVSRTGYTGEDGFELYSDTESIKDIWNTLLKAGVTPCGLGCRDTLRFEAGLPLYGDELSEKISPVMAGLSMFCKLDKEEFIGKDAIAKQKEEGPAQKIAGLELEDKAVPRAGYPVETPEGMQVGVVTTGYHSVSLDKSICFALVDKAYTALGTPLQVRIRKKTFPCKVVKKRFYQTNYKK